MKSVLEIRDQLAKKAGAQSARAQDEPRISGPFPARVKGTDSCGRRFKTDTELENLSAHDCLLILLTRVESGQPLCLTARVSNALVALRGEVTNAALRADGRWNIAVRFTRHRFVHLRNNLD